METVEPIESVDQQIAQRHSHQRIKRPRPCLAATTLLVRTARCRHKLMGEECKWLVSSVASWDCTRVAFCCLGESLRAYCRRPAFQLPVQSRQLPQVTLTLPIRIPTMASIRKQPPKQRISFPGRGRQCRWLQGLTAIATQESQFALHQGWRQALRDRVSSKRSILHGSVRSDGIEDDVWW